MLTDPSYFEQTAKADLVLEDRDGYIGDLSDSEVILVFKWNLGSVEFVFENHFIEVSDYEINRVEPISGFRPFIEETLAVSTNSSPSTEIESVIACNPDYYSSADILQKLI